MQVHIFQEAESIIYYDPTKYCCYRVSCRLPSSSRSNWPNRLHKNHPYLYPIWHTTIPFPRRPPTPISWKPALSERYSSVPPENRSAAVTSTFARSIFMLLAQDERLGAVRELPPIFCDGCSMIYCAAINREWCRY